PGRLLRDRAAPPAREAGEGAGVDRPAAARLRPARLLPLARRARVGLARARPARRARRPPRRRLRRVGRSAVRVYAPRRPVRADRGLGHRLGPEPRLAPPARRSLAWDRRATAAARGGAGRRRPAARRLAPL